MWVTDENRREDLHGATYGKDDGTQIHLAMNCPHSRSARGMPRGLADHAQHSPLVVHSSPTSLTFYALFPWPLQPCALGLAAFLWHADFVTALVATL